MLTSQEQILQYCVKNVTFDGWTQKLLKNACKSVNLDKNHWKILFPNGVVDAVDAYVEQANIKMSDGLDLSKMRTPEKIRALIKNRLDLFEREKPAIRSSIAFYALHPASGIAASYRTVDAIWRIAGDTATDWNFYSKRALLAGVYWSTLNHWLADDSDGHTATWQHLDTKLADVAKFGKFTSKVKRFLTNSL